jgi:hypothetical protein
MGKLSIAGAMTEKELQANIIKMAHALGWLVMHTRPSLNRRGQWATQLTGDPGFPDLVLAKDEQVLIWELKTEKGILSDSQREWLNAISRHTPMAAVIRPSDWLSGEVERILKRKPSKGSAYGPDMDHVSSWVNPDGTVFRVGE